MAGDEVAGVGFVLEDLFCDAAVVVEPQDEVAAVAEIFSPALHLPDLQDSSCGDCRGH